MVLYPDVYTTSEEKLYQSYLRKYCMALSQTVIDDIDRTEEIQRYERYFVSIIKPKDFTGPGSVELKIERDFEKLCIILEKHTTRNVKQMTVKEFYALLSYIKENPERQIVKK